jgi:hypothetical protein
VGRTFDGDATQRGLLESVRDGFLNGEEVTAEQAAALISAGGVKGAKGTQLGSTNAKGGIDMEKGGAAKLFEDNKEALAAMGITSASDLQETMAKPGGMADVISMLERNGDTLMTDKKGVVTSFKKSDINKGRAKLGKEALLGSYGKLLGKEPGDLKDLDDKELSDLFVKNGLSSTQKALDDDDSKKAFMAIAQTHQSDALAALDLTISDKEKQIAGLDPESASDMDKKKKLKSEIEEARKMTDDILKTGTDKNTTWDRLFGLLEQLLGKF